MADVASIVEAAGTGAGAVVIIVGALYKPMIRRVTQGKADDLFLHGVRGIPGIRKSLAPAAERLGNVEVEVKKTNATLQEHGVILQRLDAGVGTVVHEVQQNQGRSMRDTVEDIAVEQKRVSEQLTKREAQ